MFLVLIPPSFPSVAELAAQIPPRLKCHQTFHIQGSLRRVRASAAVPLQCLNIRTCQWHSTQPLKRIDLAILGAHRAHIHLIPSIMLTNLRSRCYEDSGGFLCRMSYWGCYLVGCFLIQGIDWREP